MSLMFLAFGFKMLWEGLSECGEGRDDSTVFSEMSEAEEAIEKLEAIKEPLLPGNERKQETGWKFWQSNKYAMFMFLMMCTEWGDTSQFVTIGLAA